MENTTNRIFGLDFIRASAFIFVVLSHLNYLLDLKNSTIISISALLGYFGVELFFVLSGFLIGNILYRDFQETEIPFQKLKTFYILRC